LSKSHVFPLKWEVPLVDTVVVWDMRPSLTFAAWKPALLWSQVG
jgi:hypothetical protein